VWLGTHNFTNLNGQSNTAIGQYAMASSVNASNNTAVGQHALDSNPGGLGNTAIGMYSSNDMQSGEYNSALGYNSLKDVTNGDKNVGIGYEAGGNITTGNHNIMIGDVDASSATGDYQLNIGNTLYGTMSATAEAGRVSIGIDTPHASAILDLYSTTKAFLPPRMTTAQRDAISSVAGMVIYNTSTNVLNFHNGTSWGAV